MASNIMQIQYNSNRITSLSNRAINRLEDIGHTLNRVSRKLNGMPERSPSGDNLERASAFLYKKTQQLDKRQYALTTLQQRTSDFMSRVQTTEKTLSNSIRHSYNQFHQTTGIGKTASAVFWEALGKALGNPLTYLLLPLRPLMTIAKAMTSVGQAIKAWYDGNGKYVIKAAIAVAGAVFAVVGALAVAATGPLGWIAVGAAWVVAVNSVLGASKSILTAYYACSGDPEMARELGSMSVSEMLFGKDSTASKVYDFVVTAACVIDVANSAISFANKIGDIFSKTNGSMLQRIGGTAKGYVNNVFLKNIKSFHSYVKENGFMKGIKQIATQKFTFAEMRAVRTQGATNNFSQVVSAVKGFKKIFYDPYNVITKLPNLSFDRISAPMTWSGVSKFTGSFRTVAKYFM